MLVMPQVENVKHVTLCYTKDFYDGFVFIVDVFHPSCASIKTNLIKIVEHTNVLQLSIIYIAIFGNVTKNTTYPNYLILFDCAQTSSQ